MNSMPRFRMSLRAVVARGVLLALVVIATVAATASVAHAYIDPGTGSFLLQAVFGVLAAATAAVVGFWSRIKQRSKQLVGRSARAAGDHAASAGPPVDSRSDGRP
jgi:hypothetical protein